MSADAPLIVIAGATATGKSAVAIELAQVFGGEIINADSRSFYRGMDIGTAKPTTTQLQQISHHLIDILEPDDPMSLATFQDLAFEAIELVLDRKRVPFLVGGSAQYLNAVVENWSIPKVAPDEQFRRTLEERLAAEGVASLQRELRERDPESADRTGENPRRIIRALEVLHVTGVPMSQQLGKGEPRYRVLQFELQVPRDELHRRVAARIDQWVDRGFVDEVRHLLDQGYSPSLPSFSSIGYREIAGYLNEEHSLQDALDRMRVGTNRLIRHQQTWFRKNPSMVRVQIPQDQPRMHDLISTHLA